MIKPKIETEIFKTIDAISQRNRKKAINLLENHLRAGEKPLYLLNMITFGLRNLIMAKASGDNVYLMDKMIMHPYVIKKSREASARFSFEELKKIYQKIFLIDLAIKTGKMSQQEAIKSLIGVI